MFLTRLVTKNFSKNTTSKLNKPQAGTRVSRRNYSRTPTRLSIRHLDIFCRIIQYNYLTTIESHLPATIVLHAIETQGGSSHGSPHVLERPRHAPHGPKRRDGEQVAVSRAQQTFPQSYQNCRDNAEGWGQRQPTLFVRSRPRTLL